MNWFKRNYEKTILLIFSCVLGAAFELSLLFYIPLQQTQNFTAGLNVDLVTLRNILFYIISTSIIYIILRRLFLWVSLLKIASGIQTYKIFWLSFLLNIFCWGFWFLVYFPGAGMNDTINLLMEPYKDPIQPLMYQILIWYGINFFTNFTHSMTVAYGLLVLTQIVFVSLVIAHLMRWLALKHIKKPILYIAVLYYAFLPAVADYSITLVKDTLFSVFTVLLVINLYDIIKGKGTCLSDKKCLVVFIVSACGMCAFRNNGFLVVAITLLIGFVVKIKNKRYILLTLCIITLFNQGITTVEKARFSTDVKFREMIGVPLAQIGAVLNYDSANLSEDESNTLNQLLPIDIWKENYRPSFADKMKFNEEFNNDWLNQHKILFLKTWAAILKDNFPIYVKAYLCHSYDYWALIPHFSNVNYPQSFFTKINNNTSADSIWGEFCAEKGLIITLYYQMKLIVSVS